jgi:hypothetical protein
MSESVQRSVKGGRDAFFENAESDRLLAMMMQFMSEHWALKERVMALESMLAEHAVLSADDISNFQPAAEEEARWGQQSFEFIQKVVEAAQNIDHKHLNLD